MSLTQRVHVIDPDSTNGETQGPAGHSPQPFTTISGTTIDVTQSTDYTQDDLINIPGIKFENSSSATATFLSSQFGPDADAIASNAIVTGDNSTNVVAVLIEGQNADSSYGFNGADLQLSSWTSGVDKFDIDIVTGSLPHDTGVTIDGTSGDDVINLADDVNGSDVVNGGGGTNVLEIVGGYSVLTNISPSIMTNMQNITLIGAHVYNFKINSGTSHAPVTIDELGTTDTVSLLLADSTVYTINNGTGQNDTFLNGAADTIVCNSNGNNYMYEGTGILNGATRIEGAGSTTLELAYDYSGGYTFSSNVQNLTKLILDAGDSYNLTTNDANVASNVTLLVDALSLSSSDSLTFNGSHETDGAFDFLVGAGRVTLTGGERDDVFEFDGADKLTVHDHINGGTGYNIVKLNGDYSTELTLKGSTLANIQEIDFEAGHDYNLKLADANVAVGANVVIEGQNLTATETLKFNGERETNGTFTVFGGAGKDTLTGGANNDILDGGGGADTLNGGAGSNLFEYKAVSDSTGPHFDTIVGLNGALDKFELGGNLSVPLSIDADVTTGTLSRSGFNSKLAADIGANQLHAHDAVLFTPDEGTFAGKTFLIIDENGVAGYQANRDLVIELSHATNLSDLTASHFIT